MAQLMPITEDELCREVGRLAEAEARRLYRTHPTLRGVTVTVEAHLDEAMLVTGTAESWAEAEDE